MRARLLVSCERRGSASWLCADGLDCDPSAELARLQTQLTEDVTRYHNEVHALLQVLFPEFRQVFADPCRPTALALLKLYPSAGSMVVADVETIAARVA